MFDSIQKAFSPPRTRAEYEQLKAIDDVFGKIGVFMVVCLLMYFLYQNRNNICQLFRNPNRPANDLVDNLHTLQSIGMRNLNDESHSLVHRRLDINDVDSDEDIGTNQQFSLLKRK